MPDEPYTGPDSTTYAQQLARLLGAGWSMQPLNDDHNDRWDRRRTLVGPDEAELGVSFSPYHQRGRVVVSGHFPHGYHRGSCSITIADSRSVEDAAREVLRRLMPEYLVDLQKAIDSRDRVEDGKTMQQQVLGRLAELPGVDVRKDHDGSWRATFWSVVSSRFRGEVDSYRANIKIEFDGLDFRTAARLLAALDAGDQPADLFTTDAADQAAQRGRDQCANERTRPTRPPARRRPRSRTARR